MQVKENPWANAYADFVIRNRWGIIILLVFLVTMNTLAVILRRRFERRW